ncbi:MAG: LysM peptidoglycan-binding domain-containing protein [candidate division KSB1 bacterium]
MKSCGKIFLTLILGVFVLGLANPVFAQKMSMEDYNKQLADCQAAEAKAKADMAAAEAEIAAATQEEVGVDAQIKAEWDAIYAMIGTDKAGVDAYRDQLKALEADVDGMMSLSPEELFKRRAEIEALQARLDEMKKSKIAALTEMQDRIAVIDGKLTQLRSRMPQALYTEYNVEKGDYLWKISGKEDIYKDPMQWMRIYSYNRDQIKNANLIYPKQVFKIHRENGPNEYLVAKGDYLAKISGAASVLGDPGMWRKVYEANKDIIGDDPSKIYPYTVLRVPR